MPRPDSLEARRAAMARCIRCGATIGVLERKAVSGRAPGGLVCRPCLNQRAAQANSQARRRADAGQCARCAIALVNLNFLECAQCRSKSRRWWAKRNGRPVPEILPPRTPKPDRPLIRPAGMAPNELRAVAMEPAPGPQGDRRLPGRPEKPCSNCGKLFAPTIRRRMLCWRCHTRDGPLAA